MDKSNIEGDEIVLTGENAAHGAVLRLTAGEEIVACDQDGIDHFCLVSTISKGEIRAKVCQSKKNIAEAQVDITLYQALTKGDKMAEIVEKCVELGVSSIVPVVTARCVARSSSRDSGKTNRWQKIAESAAKQSGRGKIPKIGGVLTLDEAISHAKGTCFFCYELEDKLSLPAFLKALPKEADAISFFIGPEGGFAAEEAAKFKAQGFAAVSLGRRILRTETAGPAVAANIMYQLDGEL